MANKTFEQLTAISTTQGTDKLPIWDDSGSVAAYITITDFQTDVIGTGFVKADGSVAMTGNLNLASTSITSTSSDTEHFFGRASVGTPSGGSANHAYFVHRGVANRVTGFALRQSSVGSTVMNAATGASLIWTHNNSQVMNHDGTTFDLLATVITSNDADTDFIFGRVEIGAIDSDTAVFAHRDMYSAGNFALEQTATGGTVLNAASGQSLSFNIADTAEMTLSATQLDITANSITSDDADTDFIFGRVELGAIDADTAVFAHRDAYTTANYALEQTAAGVTRLNSSSGNAISFCINDDVKMSMSAGTINISSLLISSNDIDGTYAFGRAEIGSTSTDTAGFGHRDFFGTSSYALEQNASGATNLNAATGQTITFSINNVTEMTMSATALDLKALTITSDDSATDYTFGRVKVGETTGDTAAFAHRDWLTATQFALEQNTSGFTTINSAATGVDVAITGTTQFEFRSTSFAPTTDNVMDLGESGQRWEEVFSAIGTINTSDAREKHSIKTSDLGLNFVNTLSPVEYEWKNNEKYQGKKFHGLIAQDVAKALRDYGLTEDDFAGYVHGGDEAMDGLRYTEFISILIRAVQELDEKYESLRTGRFSGH